MLTRRMWAAARDEAWAIVKSPGWLMSAFAPFAVIGGLILFAVVFAPSSVLSSVAVSVEPKGLERGVIERARKRIGPDARIDFKDPGLAYWVLAPEGTGLGGSFEYRGEILTVENHVHMDLVTGEVLVDTYGIEEGGVDGFDVPGAGPEALLDVLMFSALSEGHGMRLGDDDFEFQVVRSDEVASGKEDNHGSIRFYIILLFAGAAGMLAVRSMNELCTAYLERDGAEAGEGLSDGEEFTAKLIGIGGAHVLVYLPWGLCAGSILFLMAKAGDQYESLAQSVFDVLGDPLRLFVLFVSSVCGYLMIASMSLLLARKCRTSASARSLVGPLGFVASLPVVVSILASMKMEDRVFDALSWAPFTLNQPHKS